MRAEIERDSVQHGERLANTRLTARRQTTTRQTASARTGNRNQPQWALLARERGASERTCGLNAQFSNTFAMRIQWSIVSSVTTAVRGGIWPVASSVLTRFCAPGATILYRALGQPASPGEKGDSANAPNRLGPRLRPGSKHRPGDVVERIKVLDQRRLARRDLDRRRVGRVVDVPVKVQFGRLEVAASLGAGHLDERAGGHGHLVVAFLACRRHDFLLIPERSSQLLYTPTLPSAETETERTSHNDAGPRKPIWNRPFCQYHIWPLSARMSW